MVSVRLYKQRSWLTWALIRPLLHRAFLLNLQALRIAAEHIVGYAEADVRTDSSH